MKIKNYTYSFKMLALPVLMAFAAPGAYGQLLPDTTCAPPNPTTSIISPGCDIVQSVAQITRVTTTGGIVNFDNTSACDDPATRYMDYTGTGKMVQQEAGKSFDVTIRYKGFKDATDKSQNKIYIDWNRNGFFDTSEYVKAPGWVPGPSPHPHSNTAINSPVTIKVPVPLFAKEGLMRMRIINGALPRFPAQFHLMTPCWTGGGDGEAEDYLVDIINPCIPPAVTSISKIANFSANISWSVRENAEFYEYLVTTDPTVPSGIGYSFTKKTELDIDTFQCDVKYYVFVRAICDTAGRTDVQWKKSDWKIDSFKTHPCCENPEVKVDQVTSTTARLSWAPIYTATGYEYAVSITDVPPAGPGLKTISNVVILQGLKPSQRYYYFVRSRCNPTPLSDWTIGNVKTLQYTSVDGLDAQSSFSMDAYPNPMTDNLVVKLNGDRGVNAKLTLIDLTGKVVYNQPVTTSEVKINASTMPSGIYIVKYSDDQHNEVMRVTKK